MKVRELIKKNFTQEQEEEYKIRYCTQRTKSAYSQHLNSQVERLRLLNFVVLAEHFTNGDVAKLFQLCNEVPKVVVPSNSESKLICNDGQ